MYAFNEKAPLMKRDCERFPRSYIGAEDLRGRLSPRLSSFFRWSRRALDYAFQCADLSIFHPVQGHGGPWQWLARAGHGNDDWIGEYMPGH